jgi:hypothetical protein
MRKIIPFKKEILFKTKLKEVTSISLEHDYKINDDVITGEFLVSGDYKITSSSINREEFNYKIPFEIAIDSRYDTSTMNLDIENFYYEIINEEILKVNIDVYVEGEYKKEEEKGTTSQVEEIGEDKEEIMADVEDRIDEENTQEGTVNIMALENKKTNLLDVENSLTDNSPNNINITNNNPSINVNDNTTNNPINIFDNINMEETYSTYYVYIVKENDTIEDILTKYNITKEELENYNDISSIKPMDKLVIPSHNE